MSDTFDFASLDGHLDAQESGAEIDIVLPGSNRPTGLKITVAGPDSQKVKNAIRWGRDQFAADPGMSEEKRDDVNRQVSARCCTSWSGATYEGADVPFNADEATRWFRKWPFVQRQVSDATGNVGRFIKA